MHGRVWLKDKRPGSDVCSSPTGIAVPSFRYGQVIPRDVSSAIGLTHLWTTLRGSFLPKRVFASQPAKHRVSGMSASVQRATGG